MQKDSFVASPKHQVAAGRLGTGLEDAGFAVRGCELTGFRRDGTPWPDCPFHVAFSAAASIGKVVLAGTLNGRVCAFDRGDGAIRWEFATKRSFETVNGIDGHGGAIDNPGALAVDNPVFVTSSYGMFGPGNVLLAFKLDHVDVRASGTSRHREPAPAG